MWTRNRKQLVGCFVESEVHSQCVVQELSADQVLTAVTLYLDLTLSVDL